MADEDFTSASINDNGEMEDKECTGQTRGGKGRTRKATGRM